MKQRSCIRGHKACEFSSGRRIPSLLAFLSFFILSVFGAHSQAAVAQQGPLEVERVMDEDSAPRAFELMLYGSDADGDQGQWSISVPPTHGLASVDTTGSPIKVDYHPQKDWNGKDFFFVQLSDGFGGSSRIRVTVNVIPSNDPPVNVLEPMIVGPSEVGQILTTDPGEWDDSTDGEKGEFTYSYQWMRARTTTETLTPIEGANSRQYLVTEADREAYLAVRVTAIDHGESGSDISSTSAISGLSRVGNSPPMITLNAPEPPEETFVLKAFTFDGNETHSSAELAEVLEGYIGESVGLNDLNEAANLVTRYYQKTSQVVARAQIPPQELDDNTIRMVVIEGHVGKIRVSENTNYTSEFISKRIEAAIDRDPLHNDDLENGLLVLNQYPGLKTRSVLERGGRPGEVDVHVYAEDEKRISGSLEYNNSGSDTISSDRFLASLDIVNVADTGGHFSAEAMVGKQPEDLSYGKLRYETPIGNRGSMFGLEAAMGTYEVTEAFVDLGLEGDSSSGKMFMSHPIILKRDLTLIAEAGFEAKNDNFYLLGSKASEDRIRNLYLAASMMLDKFGGRTYVAGNLTQGLGGFMGGSENDSKTSRVGADNDFNLLQLSVAHLRPVIDNISLYASISGQLSSYTLMSSEEWQVGGVDSVRGYAPGALSGNQGYQTSVEMRYTNQGQVPWVAYSFLDHGYVNRDRPLVAQDESDSLTGAGIGASLQYKADWYTSNLTLNLGWPIDPTETSLGKSPVLNINLSVDY